MSEALEHEADHGQLDHGFGNLWLVIFGEAPPSAQPSQGAFDHPAAGQQDETRGIREAADDDEEMMPDLDRGRAP